MINIQDIELPLQTFFNSEWFSNFPRNAHLNGIVGNIWKIDIFFLIRNSFKTKSDSKLFFCIIINNFYLQLNNKLLLVIQRYIIHLWNIASNVANNNWIFNNELKYSKVRIIQKSFCALGMNRSFQFIIIISIFSTL